MKRLSVSAVLAFALLVAPVSALAATAEPLSPSQLAVPAAFTATPDGSLEATAIFYKQLEPH